MSFFCAILLRPKGMRRQPDGDSLRDLGNHFRGALGGPSLTDPAAFANSMFGLVVHVLASALSRELFPSLIFTLVSLVSSISCLVSTRGSRP